MSRSGDKALPVVIVVTGPTASGKSDLALLIVERFGGEIVNADSMQVYRGMNIGTAKPPSESLLRLPHHLFDIVDPDEDFTAADFSRIGRGIIADISSRGRIPVVVGGTGLYIKALISGLVDAPGGDSAVRKEYRQLAGEYGNEHLLDLLRKVDPESAARIHPNNMIRIIRALEVYRLTGRPISAYQGEHGFKPKWCDSIKIGIHVERDRLYERINGRVDCMIAEGLVDEVAALLSKGYSSGLKSLSSIGYKEICDHLAGRTSLAEAVERIKLNSRRYAKRQLTWFRSDPEVRWFEFPVCIDDVAAYIGDFLVRKK